MEKKKIEPGYYLISWGDVPTTEIDVIIGMIAEVKEGQDGSKSYHITARLSEDGMTVVKSDNHALIGATFTTPPQIKKAYGVQHIADDEICID